VIDDRNVLTKNTGACSGSSRNYDLTTQFCNTIRQRGQRSVALNHYVVARRASTNHGTQLSALAQKLRQNTNYIYSLVE